MAFHTPKNIRFTLDMEIQFKPVVETGLLVYMAEHPSDRTSDFWAVEMYDGYIQLRYNAGSEEPTVIRSVNTVNASQGMMQYYTEI